MDINIATWKQLATDRSSWLRRLYTEKDGIQRKVIATSDLKKISTNEITQELTSVPTATWRFVLN